MATSVVPLSDYSLQVFSYTISEVRSNFINHIVNRHTQHEIRNSFGENADSMPMPSFRLLFPCEFASETELFCFTF